MNSRSLSPFLISFLLVGAAITASTLAGQDASVSSSFASCQTLPVDASGAFVDPAPTAVVAAAATPVASVPQVVAVPKPTYSISRDALIETLSRQLASHFNLSGDLSVDLLSTWTPPPASPDPQVATIVEYPSQLSPEFIVRVHIESSSTEQPDYTVSVRAQLWRNAWATRGPVGRGDLFVPNALDVRRVDCLRNRDALFTNAATRNLAFARGLPAGQLLNWRDVSKRSLVKRGEIVEVVAVDGNLSVTMKGVAMQNGGMGDLIAIRNPESQKEITAMVVAENRAEVRF